MFKKYDENGDGHMTKTELRRFVLDIYYVHDPDLGEKLEVNEVTDMITKSMMVVVDENEDKFIEYEEWKKFMIHFDQFYNNLSISKSNRIHLDSESEE